MSNSRRLADIIQSDGELNFSDSGHLQFGTKSGESSIYLGKGDTNLYFYDYGDAIIPVNAGGIDRLNSIDFGATWARYKRQYLSDYIDIASNGNSIRMGDWDGVNMRIEAVGRPLFITSYDGSLNLGIDNDAKLTVSTAGNVGIGQTSPDSLLHVEGDGTWIRHKGYGQLLDFGNWAEGEARVESTYAPLVLVAAGTEDIKLRTGGTDRLTINSEGQVNIAQPLYLQRGMLNSYDCFEKILGTPYFTNGTANLAVDIEFGNNSFWGYIEVDITATYSNQNSAGKMSKLYAVGTNPNGLVYVNESRVSDNMGTIRDNIALGEFTWSSAKNAFLIPISHIVATGNSYSVRVKMFTDGRGAEGCIEDVVISDMYTLTALEKQDYVEYRNLEVTDDLRLNIPYFQGRKDGHQTEASGNNVVGGWTSLANNRASFNTSTGRFTAPLKGVYHFCFSPMTVEAASGDVQFKIYKNGSVWSGSNNMSTGGPFRQTTVNAVIPLEVGDYVDPVAYSNQTTTARIVYSGNYSNWMGHKIG